VSYSTNITVWCDAKECHDHIVTSADHAAAACVEAKIAGWFYRKIKGASTLEKRSGSMYNLCPKHGDAGKDQIRDPFAHLHASGDES